MLWRESDGTCFWKGPVPALEKALGAAKDFGRIENDDTVMAGMVEEAWGCSLAKDLMLESEKAA